MSKLEFKAEMFRGLQGGTLEEVMQKYSDAAQAIYDKHVEGLPKAYGRYTEKHHGWYSKLDTKYHTHTARLEAMEKLPGGEK